MADASAIRNRILEVLRQKHGAQGSSAIRALASDSGIRYSTLSRFLRPDAHPGKSTVLCRYSTLRAIAIALDLRFEWLLDGQGARQLGIWPILAKEEAASEIPAPEVLFGEVLSQLGQKPEAFKLAAMRAAVAAVLSTAASFGEMMPPRTYRCLMALDALQRSVLREDVA